MNDYELEQQLRKLHAPELPEAWRAEILATALRPTRTAAATSRQAWPSILIYLRQLFARNPITASALTALWLLILLFRFTTPIDPDEKNLLAHYDPNRPIYIVTLQDEIQLAQLLEEAPEPRCQIP